MNGVREDRQVELIQLLQTAAKGKAPVVAIPVEGKAPVCLNRKRLAAWIKGVTVLSVEVSHLGLKIVGTAGRVKTTCTMIPIARASALKEIRNWAEKERERNLKVIAQGATGAAAIKAALKAEKAKQRAAKLVEMEKGGSTELESAKSEERNVIDAAKRQGRGNVRTPYAWERENAEAAKEEKNLRHVAHHNTPHRVRKQTAVIRWRMRTLRAEWYDVTKFNPHRRKSTANKFLKVKKAIRVIQIVKEWTELSVKLAAIRPESIPNPRWPDETHKTFWIDPLDRPRQKKQNDWEYDRYNREEMAIRLRNARETIRLLTPPSDEIEVAA
jgi:hypothetical protein